MFLLLLANNSSSNCMQVNSDSNKNLENEYVSIFKHSKYVHDDNCLVVLLITQFIAILFSAECINMNVLTHYDLLMTRIIFNSVFLVFLYIQLEIPTGIIILRVF